MRFGTFHLMTQYAGATSGQIVVETLAEAEWAERLGYDRVWLTEHHASDHGICSAPAVFAAAVAARTQKIGLGFAVNVAPLHHPLRLAEELAMVDQLSGGRVVAGFGPGYSPYEFARYGVDVGERYTRHDEVVEVVLKAWTGERFDHEGEHFNFVDAQALPAPVRPLPVAITASSVAGARYAARAGYRLLTLGGVDKVREIIDAYAAEMWRSGHGEALIEDNLARVGVLKHVYIADSDDEAQAAIRAPTEMLLRRLDVLTTEDGAGTGAVFEEELAAEMENYLSTRFVAGSMETVRAEIAALSDAGCGEVLCWFRWGAMGHAEAVASMHRFEAVLRSTG